MRITRNRSDWRVYEARIAYVFISLPLFLYFLFTLYPALRTLQVSFTEYSVFSPPKWVGIANFKRLLEDELFWLGLRNAGLFTVISIPLSMVGGLAVALLLNRTLRGITVWRSLYYLPVITSTVVVATVWSYLLNGDAGLINRIIYEITGWDAPNWLYDPFWIIPSVAVMAAWQSLGTNMIIYLAGLQGIPQVLYEAARIDGAGSWRLFWHVTLPSLRPTTFFLLVTSAIGAFQVFDLPYVVTQSTASSGTAGVGPGLTSVAYIYSTAFQSLEMGYASAQAFVLFAIILVISVLNFRFVKSDVDS